MLIVTPQAQARLPIGTVLMYSGLQIANVAARTLPLGQEIGDTLSDIPFGTWYVCNGNTGTPNILNKFVRCEDSSGVFGGSDLHTLTTAEMPAHRHSYVNYNYFGTDQGMPYATVASWNKAIPLTHYAGGGGAHNNVPAYYSLIFIIRMS